MRLSSSINGDFAFHIRTQNFLIIIAVLARVASPFTIDLAFLTLIFLALQGPLQALKAIALCWLFVLLSPAVGAVSTHGNFLRLLVMLSSFFSVLIYCRPVFWMRRKDLFLLITFVFFTFCVLHSLLFSPLPSVSVLKVFSWTVTLLTVIFALKSLPEKNILLFETWLTNFLMIIVIVSIPLWFSDAGFIRNNNGFQGILNHPQAFGLTAALSFCCLIGRLFENRHLVYNDIFGLIIAVLSIYASQTRTAAFAALIALGVALIFCLLPGIRRFWANLPIFKNKKFLILVFLLSVIGVSFLSYLLSALDQFLAKRDGVSSFWQAYVASREILYAPLIENILASPWAGIGFGIASDLENFRVIYDPFFKIPISAPVEKGVLPLLVLEEIGIIGFAIFVSWCVVAILAAIRNGFQSFLLISVILLINLGEAVLLSPGGMGTILIVLFGCAVSKRKSIQ